MSWRIEMSKDNIGYGRPPKKTQFKPGQSGNPRGRPKKSSRSFLQIFDDALSSQLTISQDGIKQNLPASEIICRQIVSKAAKGDFPAIKQVWTMVQAVEKTKEDGNDIPPPVKIVIQTKSARNIPIDGS